jgi:hypothetical protein
MTGKFNGREWIRPEEKERIQKLQASYFIVLIIPGISHVRCCALGVEKSNI